MHMVKSLFRVEWWLREAEGVTTPARTEHFVYTRKDMRKFARRENERDRTHNCVYTWCMFEK